MIAYKNIFSSAIPAQVGIQRFSNKMLYFKIFCKNFFIRLDSRLRGNDA
jgi:hypothetical protein